MLTPTRSPRSAPDTTPSIADAFESLVRRHTGPLLGMARRILRTETEAREAVRDAFAAVQRSSRALADEASTVDWLRRLVVGAVLRRSGAQTHAASVETLLPVFTAEGRLDSGRLSWPLSDDQLADPQRIRHGIDQLPDECRAVVLLRDGEGLDCAAIAWALQTSEGVVRQKLQSAHMALRELVARAPHAGAQPA